MINGLYQTRKTLYSRRRKLTNLGVSLRREDGRQTAEMLPQKWEREKFDPSATRTKECPPGEEYVAERAALRLKKRDRGNHAKKERNWPAQKPLYPTTHGGAGPRRRLEKSREKNSSTATRVALGGKGVTGTTQKENCYLKTRTAGKKVTVSVDRADGDVPCTTNGHKKNVTIEKGGEKPRRS